MEEQTWIRYTLMVCLVVLMNTRTSFGQSQEIPPSYGYDDLPQTRFTCEGKLPGRYYADPETDCQMFHVCVKMSRRETQDFKFLCPNGTVFDQEHLVCADYYQVACNAAHSNTFGHIFEFLKLSAAGKDDSLTFGKVPLTDPEYLGRNTLGGEDFQVEEYNNNKLAASGNSLPYNSQSFKSKDIRFPTTPTRRTTTQRPTQRSTTTTTTTTTPLPTTLDDQYNQYNPVEETVGIQSTTYQNNLNFHRETDAPQSFPTTTRRPDYFQTTNYDNNYNNNNNKNNFGFNSDYTTTTYAPQTYQTSTRRPSFYQQQTNPTTNYNFQDSFAPSTFPTTTRRPTIFQSTFRTNLDALTTPSPVQPQATYQQQSSRFNEDFFKKIPTTEQSTTLRTQNLFYNGNPIPRHTTYSPIAPSTTYRNNDYYTTQDAQYFPQGRSINSQSQFQSFLKTDKPNQFATKPTAEPSTYSTFAPTYYEPTKATSQQAPSYETTFDPTTTTTTTTPEPTTTTTTTTARPRRGGRRRVNPNRQRQQQQQAGQGPRNFDPQFKYSRRVESSRFNERESFAVKQKTEEIFNAEASVFRGQPKSNVAFYTDDKRQSSPNVEQTKDQRRPTVSSSFGGENFGRRIRPNKQQLDGDAKPSRTSSAETEGNSRPERPEGTRVVKRLRQKTSTATTSTTTETFPTSESSTISEQPFTHTTIKPARVTVRTRTIIGGINGGNAENNGTKNGRRRVVIKTIRPKSSTSTEEPILITASVAEQELIRASASAAQNRDDHTKKVFTTLQVEEITPTTTYKPFIPNSKNITATVGGFKVTVVSSKSSDQTSSSSSSQSQQQSKKATQNSQVKPAFPKLNKKLIGGNSNEKSDDNQVGSTQSPDYDYSYYNTDDESQYVAEQNSQDRLYGKKARNRAAAIGTPV